MKLVFSTIVVIALLIVYVCLVGYAILIVRGITDSDFNSQMASSMALIGGLISALVIAELAVTEPGEVPTARLLSKDLAQKRKRILQIVTGLYLSIWIITGFSAFIFGYLFEDPETLPPLADLGQAWLGIAVGAGYSYFNIKPKGNE